MISAVATIWPIEWSWWPTTPPQTTTVTKTLKASTVAWPPKTGPAGASTTAVTMVTAAVTMATMAW